MNGRPGARLGSVEASRSVAGKTEAVAGSAPSTFEAEVISRGESVTERAAQPVADWSVDDFLYGKKCMAAAAPCQEGQHRGDKPHFSLRVF
ncbi:hypothetical protein Aduo_012126 [Ancylostoma duodenale]